MDVPEEFETLRHGVVRKGPLTIQSDTDVAVDGVAGLSLELLVDIASAWASTYGVKVCASPDGQEETSIFYDARENLLKVDTTRSGPEDTPRTVEAGPIELKDGERLKLRIFVDRSVVEVFANSRQAVMRRIYPSRGDSVGVCLFSYGGDADVHSFEAWHITPSNVFEHGGRYCPYGRRTLELDPPQVQQSARLVVSPTWPTLNQQPANNQ